DNLVQDDPLRYGTKIVLQEDGFKLGTDSYQRIAVSKPPPAPAKWAGLIGEYGWDHDVLYILEKEGKLHALIEWFFLYPLEEVSADTFKFLDWGLYDGEKVIFKRYAAGRDAEVEGASVVFKLLPSQG